MGGTGDLSDYTLGDPAQPEHRFVRGTPVRPWPEVSGDPACPDRRVPSGRNRPDGSAWKLVIREIFERRGDRSRLGGIRIEEDLHVRYGGTTLRAIAIVIEVLILMGVIYCLFLAARLTMLDVGFDSKYNRFVTWTLRIVGGMVSAFFIAHLTLFYPKLLP
jgi:hypothetical protein